MLFATDEEGTRRVQVRPELVVAATSASKWAQPFDATLTDVFQVQAATLENDEATVRRYAEIARAAFAQQLTAVPGDAQRQAFLGLALAYQGRKVEAIREAERAVELLPVSKDAYSGPYIRHQLVRVYILTGDHEKALGELEALLRIPYYLTPAWLAIDPNFAPLKGNPRFEKLLAKKT